MRDPETLAQQLARLEERLVAAADRLAECRQRQLLATRELAEMRERLRERDVALRGTVPACGRCRSCRMRSDDPCEWEMQ